MTDDRAKRLTQLRQAYEGGVLDEDTYRAAVAALDVQATAGASGAVAQEKSRDTTPVGIFPTGASPYGVLDMAGNVGEWTRSLWGKDFDEPEFKYPYDASDGRENLEAGKGVYHVLRGGSFHDGGRVVRRTSRLRYLSDLGVKDQGFRVIVAVGAAT